MIFLLPPAFLIDNDSSVLNLLHKKSGLSRFHILHVVLVTKIFKAYVSRVFSFALS